MVTGATVGGNNMLLSKFIPFRIRQRLKISKARRMGVKIGERCCLICGLFSFGTEPYLISIGNDCTITGGVIFLTHDGGIEVINHLKHTNYDKIGLIHVGDNVFIGNDAKILMGVNVGNNVIIGAGSVVTKDVPSNMVVAGVPAKVICSIEDFYSKNRYRLFPTRNLSSKQKKAFLIQEQAKGAFKNGDL